jgi:hypothetical protein
MRLARVREVSDPLGLKAQIAAKLVLESGKTFLHIKSTANVC